MTKSTLLLFMLLASISIKAYSYSDDSDHIKCTHDQLEHEEPDLLDIEEDMSAAADGEGRLLASSYPNIRMVGYYGRLSSAPSSYKSYIENELTPPVIAYFESALRVKYPSSSKLKVSSGTVCSVTTPSILKTGVDADYVIILDSELDTSSSWVAESYSCNLASGTRRPLVGKTIFNRDLLKDANGDVLIHEKNTYLLIHEMMHTLGFSSSMFTKFIGSNGKALSGHIKKVTLNGKTHSVLNVPSLTEKIRNHFGCSTLAGAYMENDGSGATAGSHFERKFFNYETMTSGVIHGRRVSHLSLGVLEASGWYDVNYDYAEPYYFGQGQGCSFYSKKCSSSSSSFDEFCTGSSRGCAPHGRGGGSCSSDSKADGCKFVKPSANYDCENPDADSYARLPSLQVFGRGAGSRCFEGTLTSSSSAGSKTSFCFKYTCNGSGSSTTVDIQVGSKTVTCTDQGTVKVSGYAGVINCPDPLTYCNGAGKRFCPRGCMGRGSCVDNKCVCRSGYKGSDCGLLA